MKRAPRNTHEQVYIEMSIIVIDIGKKYCIGKHMACGVMPSIRSNWRCCPTSRVFSSIFLCLLWWMICGIYYYLQVYFELSIFMHKLVTLVFYFSSFRSFLYSLWSRFYYDWILIEFAYFRDEIDFSIFSKVFFIKSKYLSISINV